MFSLFFPCWPRRLSFWCHSQVSSSSCLVEFSAYLGWWSPWLFVLLLSQPGGSNLESVYWAVIMTLPCWITLLWQQIRLFWLLSRCFLKNNRRASCFSLIHQDLKCLLQCKYALTKNNCTCWSGRSSQKIPVSQLRSLFLFSQHWKRNFFIFSPLKNTLISNDFNQTLFKATA